MSLKACSTLKLSTLVVPHCDSAIKACTGQVLAARGPGYPSHCPVVKFWSKMFINRQCSEISMNSCPTSSSCNQLQWTSLALIFVIMDISRKRQSMCESYDDVKVSSKSFKCNPLSPCVSLCKNSFAGPLISLPPPQSYCLVLPARGQNLWQQNWPNLIRAISDSISSSIFHL